MMTAVEVAGSATTYCYVPVTLSKAWWTVGSFIVIGDARLASTRRLISRIDSKETSTRVGRWQGVLDLRSRPSVERIVGQMSLEPLTTIG